MTGFRRTSAANRSAYDGSLGGPPTVRRNAWASFVCYVTAHRRSPRRAGWGIEVWSHAG
jgi:hypothetical protein